MMVDLISSGQAACVMWFGESQFATSVHCHFQREYRKQCPAHKSMISWHAHFIATECRVHRHSSQCLTSVSKVMSHVCVGEVYGAKKSTRHACKQTPADPSQNDVAHPTKN